MNHLLLSLILGVICMTSFTHAELLESSSRHENIFREMARRVEQEKAEAAAVHDTDETLRVTKNLMTEVTKIYDQIADIRNSVPYGADETPTIKKKFSQVDTSISCDTCKAFVSHLQALKNSKLIEGALDIVADEVCKTKLKINQTVCNDAIHAYSPDIYEALITRAFDPEHVCERFYMCPKSTHRGGLDEYIKEVLADKPPKNLPTPNKQRTYRMLHLTDPHIDLEYQVGVNSDCDSPLCCRNDSGMPNDTSKASQFWGTQAGCDVPLRTFDQFLQFVSKNYEVDMIIWTGDNIAHNIWAQSASTQTINTFDATQELIKYFPDTHIYPMFGNHEAYPADEFDFIGNSSDWLLSQLSSIWGGWLDANALSTFRNRSYYAMENPDFNVKIIALDMEACDSMDFFLIENPTDPFDQLAWLRQELYDSEAKEQPVFIMGHIPPGNSGCDSEWSARYKALIDRFVNIIRGQFFGHTHCDEFEVVRSYGDNSTVGTVFIAPSFTTYSYHLPSFRIFEVDADTNVPVNYYQFRLDLDKWNKNLTGPIEWDIAYDALTEYGLPDLSFASFEMLSNRFLNEKTVAETYATNQNSGGYIVNDLSADAIAHLHCESSFSVSEDVLKCLGLNATTSDIEAFAQQLFPGRWFNDDC